MISIKMKWSRKGAKDNTTKLAWSKYFKYVVEGKEYFFKQKAYTTYSDGWINSEIIKEQTYKKAIKRGNECIEILVEEDMSLAVAEYLIIIFSDIYNISKNQTEKAILKANKTIEKIKQDSEVSAATEYKIFKKVLDDYVSSAWEENAI